MSRNGEREAEVSEGPQGDTGRLRWAIKNTLIEVLGLPISADSIGDDEPIFGPYLGLGPVTSIDVITVLEHRFGIEFSPDEIGMDLFRSVASLSSAVMRKTDNRGTSVEG